MRVWRERGREMAISVWRGEAGLSFGAAGGMGHVISHPRMQVSLCLILSRSLSLSVCLCLFVSLSLSIFLHLSVSVSVSVSVSLSHIHIHTYTGKSLLASRLADAHMCC